MHIALGAYLLSGTPGYRQAGIHQYIRALLEALERGGEGERGRRGEGEVRFTALISPTARDEVPISNLQSQISLLPASRSTESPLQRIWVEQVETPGVLRRLGAGVYHGMAFIAPLRAPCPTVITVHDLSFLTQPHTHKRFNRLYLALFTRWSCQRAARVIAVSEWTRRDVVNLLGVDPERVDVIPHGVHARFKPLPPEQVAAFRQANSIGDRAIFFLGSLEPRKNLTTLIEAFARISSEYRVPSTEYRALSTEHSALSTQHSELIIGGSPGWKYQPIFERIEALGLKDRVRFIGQVAQDDLPKWYNACAVFAYPSLYEGFGLPVLEAMACGAPVVTSDVTSLPEVAGDAGITVPPTDDRTLADALARVLEDDRLRQYMRTASLRRAATFTWQRAAEQTIETYVRAAQHSNLRTAEHFNVL